METIKIYMKNLKVNINGDIFDITHNNGSGLYDAICENGEKCRFTRNELKKLCDINAVDETLEMLYNMECEKVYTDDMLNFITEFELKKLKFQEDYKKVVFKIVE